MHFWPKVKLQLRNESHRVLNLVNWCLSLVREHKLMLQLLWVCTTSSVYHVHDSFLCGTSIHIIFFHVTPPDHETVKPRYSHTITATSLRPGLTEILMFVYGSLCNRVTCTPSSLIPQFVKLGLEKYIFLLLGRYTHFITMNYLLC